MAKVLKVSAIHERFLKFPFFVVALVIDDAVVVVAVAVVGVVVGVFVVFVVAVVDDAVSVVVI